MTDPCPFDQWPKKFSSYITHERDGTLITLPTMALDRSFAVFDRPDGVLELKLHKVERPIVTREGWTYYGTYTAEKRVTDRYTSSILIEGDIGRRDGCYDCTITEGGMELRRTK